MNQFYKSLGTKSFQYHIKIANLFFEFFNIILGFFFFWSNYKLFIHSYHNSIAVSIGIWMIMQNGIQMIISHNFVANNVKNVQISFQNPNNYIPLNIIKHPCGFSLVWRQLIHLRHAWHVIQWLIITIIFLSILDWNKKKKRKKKKKNLTVYAFGLET